MSAGESGVMHVFPLTNTALLSWLQNELLKHWFPRDVAYYNQLDAEIYRSLVGLAQDAINLRSFTQLLAADLREQVYELLGSEQVLVQAGLYLRAARPVAVRQESVGFHRESFYGANGYEFNFWVPVHGVSTENAPLYVPDSDKIPDAAIKIRQVEEDPAVKSNKIGLLKRPFEIVDGVDLTKARPFDVPYGSAAIFPGSLIHGAAQNTTGQIRMSVDFRLVAKDKMLPERREHYIDLL
jgi:Phytanoyl-CoA dioxygenase (PhyH)